jgi:hypothetical protein
MIHGQILGRKGLAAIVARAFGELLLPPIAFSQFLGPVSLSGHMLGIFLDFNPVVRHGSLRSDSEKLVVRLPGINEKRSLFAARLQGARNWASMAE